MPREGKPHLLATPLMFTTFVQISCLERQVQSLEDEKDDLVTEVV